MNEAEQRLMDDQSMRAAARALFSARLSRVKNDLQVRPIPARIKDRIIDKAADAADTATEVAHHNKGIIAGTLVLVVGWFFRRPLMDGTSRIAHATAEAAQVARAKVKEIVDDRRK